MVPLYDLLNCHVTGAIYQLYHMHATWQGIYRVSHGMFNSHRQESIAENHNGQIKCRVVVGVIRTSFNGQFVLQSNIPSNRIAWLQWLPRLRTHPHRRSHPRAIH